jgi:phosphatidylglycerophosphate synthase
VTDRAWHWRANAVTAARLAVTPLLVWAVVRGAGAVAAVAFAIAATSDVVDGRVARRAATANALGRAFDHGSDIVFLLSAYAAYAVLGVIPWWAPAAIAVAFAVYVLDSVRRPDPVPARTGNRIGHLGGICNYVLLGVVVANQSLGLGWLSPSAVRALFALVPLYSATAVAARFTAARRVHPQTDPAKC